MILSVTMSIGVLSAINDKAQSNPMPFECRFVDRDMVMRHHKGLGVGHIYTCLKPDDNILLSDDATTTHPTHHLHIVVYEHPSSNTNPLPTSIHEDIRVFNADTDLGDDNSEGLQSDDDGGENLDLSLSSEESSDDDLDLEYNDMHGYGDPLDLDYED